MDSAFDAYSVEAKLLGSFSGSGVILASNLQSLCKNQLTVIAAIKYLAILAEEQGYMDIHERVRGALSALDMTAEIIALTVADLIHQDRAEDEIGGDKSRLPDI